MKRCIVVATMLAISCASATLLANSVHAQTSSIFALPSPDAQRAHARGYMLNDGVSAQMACGRAVIPSQSNPYTQAQCLQDMAAAAPDIKETRQIRQKAAQDEIAAGYPAAIEQAVRASLEAGSTDFACDNALRDDKSIPDEERDDASARCEKEMLPIYYQRVRDPSYKPLNCAQWAIKEGDAWRSAHSGMQYRPLATSSGPVAFSGDIKNAEDSRLTVIDGDLHPAYVDVDASTFVVNPNDIQVGSAAFGYGTVSGKANVELTTGAAMTIPVIKAACIE